MDKKDKKGLDINLNVTIPELKPISDAVKSASDETVKGLKGFLSSLCVPVSVQVGGLLEDKVKQWRYRNALNFANKARKLHIDLNIEETHQVHPRLMLEILEGVSKQQDDELLDWWAGLTVSSCEECPTDTDLIFTNLMGNITCLQKSVIEYACKTSKVVHTSRGLILARPLEIREEEIFNVAGSEDIDVIDRELDSLRNYGLIGGGFNMHNSTLEADITPTSLALHFYARCNGVRNNLIGFYSSTEMVACPQCGRVHK